MLCADLFILLENWPYKKDEDEVATEKELSAIPGVEYVKATTK